MNANIRSDGVRSIVERARAGDQVAMALIVETREQAKKGNTKAAVSAKLLQQYIDKHPPSAMAGDASSVDTQTNPKAQAAVWKARKSSPEQFAIIIAKAAPVMRVWDVIVALAHGPRIKDGTPLMEAAKIPNSRLAACIRRAFCLQRLANPSIPISSYCRTTGAELGE